MYPIISVDDHVIEAADVFTGRLPSHLVGRAPRLVSIGEGREAWEYEGKQHPNVALNAVAGLPKERWSFEPTSLAEIRPGCYDAAERIKDMEQNGVWASLNFPSLIAGFCGALFARSDDPELGLACIRAWNDWVLEDWVEPFPERFIPMQLPWLADPHVTADEVRRNAARGFKALSFAQFPARMGYPSLHTGHWDPVLEACEETDTVICLHTGSSGWKAMPSDDGPFELSNTMFPATALMAAADWLWSGVCLRYPGLDIALSEGGMGWVAMLADRADYVVSHSGSSVHGNSWSSDLLPSEVLGRNFWFCSIDDPHSVDAVDSLFGLGHVMVETDYPHADSTWPETGKWLEANYGHLSDDKQRDVCYRNAARLFRHPLPPGVG
jgi:predicted TIM-barrel fold metal-dependent hydrolase